MLQPTISPAFTEALLAVEMTGMTLPSRSRSSMQICGRTLGSGWGLTTGRCRSSSVVPSCREVATTARSKTSIG